MAVKITVKYNDGRTVDVLASPKVMVQTEANFNGVGAHNRIRATYFMAWKALSLAGKESLEYDPWLDTISEVEENDEDVDENGVAASDPTQPAPSPDGSSV